MGNRRIKMKKLYIILVIAMFFACDLDNPWPIDTNVQDVSGAEQKNHSVTFVISGNAPVISSDIINDEFYYGLDEGANYTHTFEQKTTSYMPSVDMSFFARKMTGDSSSLTGEIIVDGTTVASQTTTAGNGIVNVQYVITDNY